MKRQWGYRDRAVLGLIVLLFVLGVSNFLLKKRNISRCVAGFYIGRLINTIDKCDPAKIDIPLGSFIESISIRYSPRINYPLSPGVYCRNRQFRDINTQRIESSFVGWGDRINVARTPMRLNKIQAFYARRGIPHKGGFVDFASQHSRREVSEILQGEFQTIVANLPMRLPQRYVGSLAYLQRVFSNANRLHRLMSLNDIQEGDKSNEGKRYILNDKALIFAGLCMFVGSLVFLYKTWWEISFNLFRDSNLIGYAALVVGQMVSAIIGMLIVVWRLMLAHGEW